MFNWFTQWRYNRRRAIFRYRDGRRWRAIDPLVAFRALKNHPEFSLERDLDLHDAGHADATALCLKATRDAFGVQEFNGDTLSGLTEAETIDLLTAFGQWMQAVKKNISPPLISSASTAPCPVSSTVPTSNCADSPSTCDAPNCDAPAL